jgi:hypothetical protein
LWETKAACPVELETIPLRDDLSFVDPISAEIIELNFDDTYLVSGDIRPALSFKYFINLKNQIDFSILHKEGLPKSSLDNITKSCQGSAVCQFHTDGSNPRPIGKWALSSTVQSDGSEIELKYLTSSRQEHSIITFQCNPMLTEGQPVFIAEATDHSFVFDWWTGKVCQTSITAASFESDSKPSHGGVIAFVIISVVILLGGCFYKRVEVLHYGTIAYMRLHSCFRTIRPFGRIRTNSHQYSRLGSGNGSDGEDDLLFGMDTVEDAVFPLVPDNMIETANLNGLEAIPESSSFGDPLGVASSSSYHDDPEESDEDLLI